MKFLGIPVVHEDWWRICNFGLSLVCINFTVAPLMVVSKFDQFFIIFTLYSPGCIPMGPGGFLRIHYGIYRNPRGNDCSRYFTPG